MIDKQTALRTLDELRSTFISLEESVRNHPAFDGMPDDGKRFDGSPNDLRLEALRSYVEET